MSDLEQCEQHLAVPVLGGTVQRILAVLRLHPISIDQSIAINMTIKSSVMPIPAQLMLEHHQ